jgi:hypothetical protein
MFIEQVVYLVGRAGVTAQRARFACGLAAQMISCCVHDLGVGRVQSRTVKNLL